MKMKVCVMGGAGYIGSHAVKELIKEGHDVTVFDNLVTGNRESVPNVANFIKGDIRNEDDVNGVLANGKFDIVMHFAALLIVPESVEKPIDYFETNVSGLANVLKYVVKYKVKGFVFSSTAATYGNPASTPVKEDDVTNPINPYGSSKLSAEYLIKGAAKAHNFNYTIFRYFNVAGAAQDGSIGQATKGKEITHLIPVVIQTLTGERDSMTIYGNDYDTKDGTCIRDYIHVVDLARAHILGAQYTIEGKSNTFNLGSSEGFSVMEVVKATEKVTGEKINFTIGEKREGDPAVLVADVSRAKNELKFEPELSLEEMISSDYNWRKNRKF